jgi:hypothetical protein
MKKLFYLIIVMVVLGLVVSGCIPVVPTAEKDETSSLTKGQPERPDVKPGIDFNGPHYNLNLIGKKVDWNAQGDFDNPDRHTMFVPLSTTGLTFPVGGTEEIPFDTLDGIKISMTSGEEFKVIDGNAFDDGECAFQLGPDKYDVYIVAKGKPGGDADITGWVYAKATDEYLFPIGHINVSRSKKWKDITDMFEVDDSEDDVPWGDWGITPPEYPMWVFDYLTFLAKWLPDYKSAEYFWQLVNNNVRLIQVRFYPD